MAFTQITANELQALIGRELTDQEFENFDTLIQVAEKQVEGYLCATLEELFPSTDKGDGEIPADLKFVIGNFFKAISVRNHYDPTVSSKKVEDYSISFREDADIEKNLVAQNLFTLRSYTKCGRIRPGKTICEDRRFYDTDSIRSIR